MSEDLVLLVPDKDIEQAFGGLLGRPDALRIRPIKHEILTHPNRDPGCYHTAEKMLEPYLSRSKHALVVFDRAWDGAPSQDPRALERDVEVKLANLWKDRARCIVIEPEIEIWIWSDSPHVVAALGWQDREPRLRTWLERTDVWPKGQEKPPDPKRAFEHALRAVRLPPSASIFRRIAATVSLTRCKDNSFREVVDVLRRWFPRQGGE